jgi:EAL domain-containing protein (putative c-di-GMP-specific phosphodiesterase class I)
LFELRSSAISVIKRNNDFGTGYSSLAYIAQLPVAAVKIDRAFITTMLDNANSAILVRTIISLAHFLKVVSLRIPVRASSVTATETDLCAQACSAELDWRSA